MESGEEIPKKLLRSSSRDAWSCPKCSFANSVLIPQCEMCDQPRPKQIKIPQPIDYEEIQKKQKVQQQKGHLCQKCTYMNEEGAQQCQICGHSFLSIKKTVTCTYCSEQVEQGLRKCTNCRRVLRKLRAPKPKKPIKVRPGICQYCKMYPYGGSLEDHQALCKIIKTGQIDQSQIVYPKQCSFCNSSTVEEGFKEHDEKCQEKLKFYQKNPNFERLTKLQRETIVYMHKKCQKLHLACRKPLLNKVVRLGYTEKDLDNLHHYIINYAPIIIHVHVNKHMEFFVKDTHYRCQFQTNKSSGSLSRSARTGWQDRMFDSKHHSAKDFERVKYGTINFTNDPKGVGACVGYGQSYLLLKQNARDRCTFTDMDSSSSSATIGTFRFCYHVLIKLSDEELKAAIEASKAQQIQSRCIGTYKQIQIHGPVEFAVDIQRLYINKTDTSSYAGGGLFGGGIASSPVVSSQKPLQLAKQFCKKNKIEYEMFGNEPPKPVARGAFGVGVGGVAFGSAFPPASMFGSSYVVEKSIFVPGSSSLSFGSSYPYSSSIKKAQKKQLKQGEDYI